MDSTQLVLKYTELFLSHQIGAEEYAVWYSRAHVVKIQCHYLSEICFMKYQHSNTTTKQTLDAHTQVSSELQDHSCKDVIIYWLQ